VPSTENDMLELTCRIGRGTTLQAGMAIAYATLDYILGNVGCRTLFATHYHELEDMLRVETEDGIERPRDGIEYWCTDVDEAVSYLICRTAAGSKRY
jgi:hypothetical protein